MILRSTNIRSALRSRQRGFLLDPYRFAASEPPGTGGHRYWRVNGLAVSGSFFEISQLRFFADGVDITQVEFTSSDVPTGTLSNLIDADLSTRCYWTEATAEGGGFYLRWDFKAARAITHVKIGGFDTSNRYPSGFDLQYSDDDSSWTTAASISGLSYPGNNTLSSAIDCSGGGDHRYWRIVNVVIPGGGFFEVSGVQLLTSTTDSAFPAFSSSDAPSSSVLSNLFDGSLSNSAAWTDTVAEAGGFWIKGDFGDDVEVSQLKLGGFDNSSRYPSDLTLQYSDDDSSWTTYGSASGLSYPGNNTLSGLITPA